MRADITNLAYVVDINEIDTKKPLADTDTEISNHGPQCIQKTRLHFCDLFLMRFSRGT